MCEVQNIEMLDTCKLYIPACSTMYNV